MSSVIDEPPAKRRNPRKKAGESAKAKEISADISAKGGEKEGADPEMSEFEDRPSRRKRAKIGDTPKVLDKDEETIKKLKGIVVACGVRKVWSKEFKDYPTPKSQISRLREILRDLGMASRPSLSEAKKIRERRELMQDAEAAMEYDRVRGAKAEKSGKGTPKSEGSSEGDEPSTAKRSKISATRSIMAFLDEESD